MPTADEPPTQPAASGGAPARKAVATEPTHSKASLRLWLRLLGCARDIEKILQNRLAAQFESTLPRFDVLSALDRHPDGLSMGALAAWLKVSNGNTTGIVRRLEEEGFVIRTSPDHDKRTAFVRLSPAGKAAFQAMAQAHETWLDGLLEALSDAELDALIRQLGGLKAAIARQREPR